MRVFPSERTRNKSDRRTVRLFFAAIALVMGAFILAVVVHHLLAAW
jgi:hypothetical protein